MACLLCNKVNSECSWRRIFKISPSSLFTFITVALLVYFFFVYLFIIFYATVCWYIFVYLFIIFYAVVCWYFFVYLFIIFLCGCLLVYFCLLVYHFFLLVFVVALSRLISCKQINCFVFVALIYNFSVKRCKRKDQYVHFRYSGWNSFEMFNFPLLWQINQSKLVQRSRFGLVDSVLANKTLRPWFKSRFRHR